MSKVNAVPVSEATPSITDKASDFLKQAQAQSSSAWSSAKPYAVPALQTAGAVVGLGVAIGVMSRIAQTIIEL
jgi:hypothetical protein